MAALILFGILVGLDNLQVSSAMGLLEVKTERKWLLIAAFGLCEAVMPLVGLATGALIYKSLGVVASAIGPVVLIFSGLLIIYLSLREHDTDVIVNSRLLIFGLPLTLSMDNLLAGIGLGAIGYPVLVSALVIGLISAAMCLIGLIAGQLISRWLPAKMELVSGSYLVLIAIMMLVLDAA